MIIGYSISAPDNNSTMNGARAGTPCVKCGLTLDRWSVNDDFELKVKTFDLSYTFDGFSIVSSRFQRFCEVHQYDTLQFRTLAKEPEFFVFDVTRVLRFDAARRGTRFEDYCDLCKRYRFITRAVPVILLDTDHVPEGFSRTDLEFGSNDAKAPILLVGRETKRALEVSGLVGLDYRDITDEFDGLQPPGR